LILIFVHIDVCLCLYRRRFGFSVAKIKTYITDYDIRETLGEGSFGAVRCFVLKTENANSF
jgi:hypothetical protein